MNIQQFQYVMAVAEYKHFEVAAGKCFISQSTLSTMISKFEEELGIKIFDRKKKPVSVTAEGLAIIEQLKTIVTDIDHLKEMVKEIKGEVKGNLSISVIPTIAPFLLPLFLQSFAGKFPNLNIKVKEQTSSEIIRQIKSRDLDIGILSIPVQDKDILELKLYDEAFVYYDAAKANTNQVKIDKIDLSKLYLMEEGHCMRTQVLKLCDLNKKSFNSNLNFEFKAGSIDSLLRFVKANQATTLLPYLSTVDFSDQEKAHVSDFSVPVPFRSVGLVVHRHFVKKQIISMLQKDIQEKIAVVLPQTDFNGDELSPF
jgi:LysR family transcriptional regulator, hydrogen peroxide-inducible genes activator